MTNDEFYFKHIAERHVLGPVLDVLIRTLPRDNLLSSACLDLFELIRAQHIKELIKHLVENYREKIVQLSYMNTFAEILNIYDQSQGYANNVENYFIESEDDVSRRPSNVGARSHMEQLTVDPAEEEYWNTSDNEDEIPPPKAADSTTVANGATKQLVDYASDEEGDENSDMAMSPNPSEADKPKDNPDSPSTVRSSSTLSAATPPLERVSEKRRREQDEDDELDKLILHKRRNSSASNASASSAGILGSSVKKAGSKMMPAGTFDASRDQKTHKKISIVMAPTLKSAAVAGEGGQDGDKAT